MNKCGKSGTDKKNGNKKKINSKEEKSKMFLPYPLLLPSFIYV